MKRRATPQPAPIFGVAGLLFMLGVMAYCTVVPPQSQNGNSSVLATSIAHAIDGAWSGHSATKQTPAVKPRRKQHVVRIQKAGLVFHSSPLCTAQTLVSL